MIQLYTPLQNLPHAHTTQYHLPVPTYPSYNLFVQFMPSPPPTSPSPFTHPLRESPIFLPPPVNTSPLHTSLLWILPPSHTIPMNLPTWISLPSHITHLNYSYLPLRVPMEPISLLQSILQFSIRIEQSFQSRQRISKNALLGIFW